MIGVDTVCPCTFGGGRISLSCSFSLTIPLPLISLSTARHLHPHPHRLSCSPHLSISLISQSPFAPRSLTIMPRRSSSTRPRRCTVLASLAERAGKHWVLPVGFCFVSPPRYSLFVRSRARSRTFFYVYVYRAIYFRDVYLDLLFCCCSAPNGYPHARSRYDPLHSRLVLSLSPYVLPAALTIPTLDMLERGAARGSRAGSSVSARKLLADCWERLWMGGRRARQRAGSGLGRRRLIDVGGE